MAPSLAIPRAISIHQYKRDDPYTGGPNLKVLIPVIVILSILGFGFFGWLGLPWPRIKAWWRRKRSGQNEPPEVNLPKDDDVDETLSTATPRRSSAREGEPAPGSSNAYGAVFELSHIDALRLNRAPAPEGQDFMSKTKSKSKSDKSEGNKPPADASARTFRGETREQRLQRLQQEQEHRSQEPPVTATLAPSEPSSGQLTPSAPPERRASPWDPTRTH